MSVGRVLISVGPNRSFVRPGKFHRRRLASIGDRRDPTMNNSVSNVAAPVNGISLRARWRFPETRASPNKKPASRNAHPSFNVAPRVSRPRVKTIKMAPAALPTVAVQGGGSVQLPEVFLSPIRPDIVNAVHTGLNKNNRQAYAVSLKAGHQTAAESWGTGRAVSRIPRVPGGGTHRAGQGAFGNMCRGGRMFAPTKVRPRSGFFPSRRALVRNRRTLSARRDAPAGPTRRAARAERAASAPATTLGPIATLARVDTRLAASRGAPGRRRDRRFLRRSPRIAVSTTFFSPRTPRPDVPTLTIRPSPLSLFSSLLRRGAAGTAA